MAKRPAGDGSIRQRSDRLWEIRLTLGTKRTSVYAPTQAEARRKAIAARRAYARGVRGPDAGTTLAAFVTTSYLPAMTDLRPRTIETYGQLLSDHILPVLGATRLEALDQHHVQAWLNAKSTEIGPRGRPLSARTVNHLRAVLRSVLAHAMRAGLIDRNVATLIRPPALDEPTSRTLSDAQARQLLAVVAGTRDETLIAVSLLGLRQGEELGLRWTDIDFTAHTLTVSAQLQRRDGVLQRVPPKSRRSVRTLAMPATVERALLAHHERSGRPTEGYVFTGSHGQPLDGSTVYHMLQRRLREAGLPPMAWHALRHSAASLLLARGVHPRVLMEILGHSQISQMARYTHVVPALGRDAADQLDVVLTAEVLVPED